MKDLYNNMVNYFMDHVEFAAMLALVSIIVIFVLIAVLSSAAVHREKKADTKTQTTVAETPAQEAPIAPVTEAVIEEAPVEEAPAEETPVEEAPAEDTPQEVEIVAEEESIDAEIIEDEPMEEPPVEEEIEETPAEEPIAMAVEEPVEEVTEEPVEEEPVAEVENTPIEEPVVEEPVAEVEDTPIEEPVVEEIAAAVATAPAASTLHDELKDVNTDLDFYEEDGVDQEARQKGRWVICRLVTDDKASNEMYFFELRAPNSDILLTSEEYNSYNGAIRGIQTHKNNILKGNFRTTLSKHGEYIFKLVSGKNMLLCLSEGYATKEECEDAIALAKRFAATAVLDENIQDQVIKVPAENNTPIEPLAIDQSGRWIIDCTEAPDGEMVYFFELFTNDNECLLTSEEYTTYIGAVNGIQTYKANIDKSNFRIVLTKRGDYVYKLLNSNGQLLCLGEHYKNKRLCQNAVDAVKAFAMNSQILTNPQIKK